MRALLIRVGCLLSLLIASSAPAVTMDWTFIGNPGNEADDPEQSTCNYPAEQPCGAVGYEYYIGTYEVTNAQYTEFLNAVADADPNGVYHTLMADESLYGGITRSGSSGSYTYSAIAGREQMPVNYVSYYDAVRFVNWLNNGQPIGPQASATTEDGALYAERG